MDQWKGHGFVVSDTCEFDILGDHFVTLEGVIECAGGILYIDVQKRLTVLDGDGPSALVQTEDYSYTAGMKNYGAIFRYDGPHDHHPSHHVHRYDVFGSRKQVSVSDHGVEGWPVLGAVIQELADWYYENYAAIEKLRQEMEMDGPIPPRKLHSRD